MTNAPKARCAFAERLLSLSVITAVFMIMLNSAIGVKNDRYFVNEILRGQNNLELAKAG
jgi:hypothetical protein